MADSATRKFLVYDITQEPPFFVALGSKPTAAKFRLRRIAGDDARIPRRTASAFVTCGAEAAGRIMTGSQAPPDAQRSLKSPGVRNGADPRPW